jgi:Tripartite ATP-independent periplasmic transporters, DctQ component
MVKARQGGERGVVAAMEGGTIAAMAVVVGSVAAGVFCRYVLTRPLVWGDEIATLGLVWLAFVGGRSRRSARPIHGSASGCSSARPR